MTLTIHRLNTVCRAPKELQGADRLVNEVAHGALRSELDGQLGPSLDRLPEVVRLQHLRVRLKISRQRWDAGTLAAAWARAFTLALHRALAYPDSTGPIPIVRHQTRAAYKAALLWHIATEGTAPCWRYPELEEFGNSSPAAATLKSLLHELELLPAVLMEAARNDWLDPLLMQWSESTLEEVFHVIAAGKSGYPVLSINNWLDLVEATSSTGGLQRQWSFSSRRQALRLWVRLSRRFSIRAIWDGLRLLRRLLETPLPLALHTPPHALLSDPTPFPSWCESIVYQVIRPRDTGSTSFATSACSTGTARDEYTFSRLDSLLEKARPLLPTSVSSGQQGKWIVSENAGVMLLLGSIRRLDFWRLAQSLELIRFGGPRAFSFFLAAIGMTLLGKWSPGDPIDSAVGLLAGCFGEPDLVGMKQFFREVDPRTVHEISQENWNEAWESAAAQAATEFVQRIRGFRGTSREGVVRQFFRVPGRVLVEDHRLLVVLGPSVWGIALHISGADDRLEHVEWLEDRYVEFVLEGL